jgi:hypothetical protein
MSVPPIVPSAVWMLLLMGTEYSTPLHLLQSLLASEAKKKRKVNTLYKREN